MMRQNKYVCAECFHDYAIKEFIHENAENSKCDYCENTSDSPISANFTDVLGFILEGIETEWEDPANSMAYESREGGYQGASVYDWYDLVTEEIEELFDINDKVLDDIISSMAGEHSWCHKDPYGLLEEEALSISWSMFSEQVKYKTRYIFSQISGTTDPRDIDLVPVPKMLNVISREISLIEDQVDIILEMDVDAQITRGRIHNRWKKFRTAKQLGTALPDKAIYSNRMSPSGIPMFYGAFDPDTAYYETIDRKRFSPPWKISTIATFKTTKKMKLLDLSGLPDIPSLFDQNMNHLRSAIIFLRDFSSTLSKPIEKDGSEHIEYVPTQVFTEYIRHLYKDNQGDHLDGIKYKSSKANGSPCCVLFITNEQCCDSSNYQNAVTETTNQECLLLLVQTERREVFNTWDWIKEKYKSRSQNIKPST